MRLHVSRFLPAILLITILASGAGCSAAQKPFACSAIRDGAFAVATYGCLRIGDAGARDACTKAGLAASLLAFQTCMKEAGTAAVAEIGDPIEGADIAAIADARAIIAEYAALEGPGSLPFDVGTGKAR